MGGAGGLGDSFGAQVCIAEAEEWSITYIEERNSLGCGEIVVPGYQLLPSSSSPSGGS